MAEEAKEEEHTFEIQVALVGYVSVGKSTVINALLGDQFSEVSMRRTTAGINYFRVSQKQKGLATATATSNANANATAGKETTTTSSNNNSSGKNVSTAEATHAEISRDNEMLRSGISNSNSSGGGGDNEDENNDENDDDDETSSNKNGALLVEKFFDIEVDESICDMRNDTKLVLIDIPGINEADSSKKYKDYVESKWDTFDCVVVVMDAIQGVNTQEQVELLKFVQRNNHHLKRIPTIVLGNKVDDPSDEDTLTLVGETRTKTIEIFGDGCTEKSLQSLLTAANNGNYYAKNKDKDSDNNNNNGDGDGDDGAVFIPVSAKNAFIYRKAVHLSVDTFDKKSGDQDLFDKIGKDEVGRRWNKMSAEEKVTVISSIIEDPAEYKERLAGTNFDNFLAVVKYFIGGNDTQKTLLANQIEIALKSLSADTHNSNNNNNNNNTASISESIHNVFKKCTAAGRSTDDLSNRFWNIYDECEQRSFLALEEEVNPSVLQRPFFELEKFYELSGILGWSDEQTNVKRKMKMFLSNQLDVVRRNEKCWTFDRFCKRVWEKQLVEEDKSRNGKSKKRMVEREGWMAPDYVSWESLSPLDLEVLLSSLLLPSCEREFYTKFGKQKVTLEKLLLFYRTTYDTPENPNNDALLANEFEYFQAIISLQDNSCDTDDEYNVIGDAKGAIAKITMPEDLSDPMHWGYISWKYSSFCRCREHDSK